MGGQAKWLLLGWLFLLPDGRSTSSAGPCVDITARGANRVAHMAPAAAADMRLAAAAAKCRDQIGRQSCRDFADVCGRNPRYQ